MALPDTAEYWNDVKRQSNKKVFTHAKGLECGHYHVSESDELQYIDCYTCKKIIESNHELKTKLERNNGKSYRKWEKKRKKKRGFKLDSKMTFGKHKRKTIQEIIVNHRGYFDWVKNKIVLHPEVDSYSMQ